jgi:hypothetical protein
MPIDRRIVESSCSKQCNALMQTPKPCASAARRSSIVRHDHGRHGATHFLTKTPPKIAAEMALPVLAYDLTRVMNTLGVIKPLMAANRGLRSQLSGLRSPSGPLLHGQDPKRTMGLITPDSCSGYLSLSIRFEAAVFWRKRKARYGGLAIALWRANQSACPSWRRGPHPGSTGFGNPYGHLTRTRQAMELSPRCANSWDNLVPEPTRGAVNKLTWRRFCIPLMRKPMSGKWSVLSLPDRVRDEGAAST